MSSAARIARYADFWLHYLRQHAHPWNRALHYLGSLSALACCGLALARTDARWLLLAPVLGYGAAWLGHFAIERNRPATFGHPLWSLCSDMRMTALFLCGRLGSELERSGLR